MFQVLSFHREAVLKDETEGMQKVRPPLELKDIQMLIPIPSSVPQELSLKLPTFKRSTGVLQLEKYTAFTVVQVRKINPEHLFGSLQRSCDHCCVSNMD